MNGVQRRRLIADALASPPPDPEQCEARAVLRGVHLRVPPSDFITRRHIRRAHAFAQEACEGESAGARYLELLQAEYARLTDAEPWYWNQLWPGGIALANHVLDHAELVRGRTVLEFGTGLGLLAVSAAVAGAKRVVAIDIEPIALAFADQSARDNDVASTVVTVAWDWRKPPTRGGVITSMIPFDVVLLPDVMYDSAAVERLGELASTLLAPGGVLLFTDGTDRPYGSEHTDRLLELLRAPPAAFVLDSQTELVAGADAADGGAAPERPVRLVSLTRTAAASVRVDRCGLVQQRDGGWRFAHNST